MKAEWSDDDIRHLATDERIFTPDQVALMSAAIDGGRGVMRQPRFTRDRLTGALIGTVTVPAWASTVLTRPQDGPRADTPHVRSTDAMMVSLLSEGSSRSSTFRALVDEVSRLNGIIYIEFGYCAFGHLDGCLFPFLVSAGGDRYLRIVLSREKKVTHDQLLGVIAHELRHALEVLEHKEVIDIETLQELYRRIGTPLPNGSSGYETSAARAAGDAVLAELSATSVDPRRAHQPASPVAPYHIFLTGRAGLMVRFALDAARRRLARPECQRLFTDFTDSSGHPLADGLAAWGLNPDEALGAVYFVEGDTTTQCRDNAATDAFTVPGNRVIFICGKRFADPSKRRPTPELTVIHELLHTLGLGENPPASADISRIVNLRCGH
jgi:hypothetical protein